MLAFALGAAAFKVGAFFNFAMVSIMAGCLLVPLERLPYLIKKEIKWDFWKAPFHIENRRYWRPILLRITFWLLCAATVFVGVVNAQFKPSELSGIKAVVMVGTVFLCLLSLVPKRVGGKPMSIFSGFAIPVMAFILGDSLFPSLSGKNAIAVNSPFASESYMYHAGHNTMINYHVAYPSQKYALDMTTLHSDGTENTGDKKSLENFACFGATLVAPVAGEVVIVVSDLIDQPIGGSDPKNAAGNHIVIKSDETHFAMLAHMKKDSARVAVGEIVNVGKELGACGNSGNTTAPHLHFQMQTLANPYDRAVRTYPIKFNNTVRVRRGKRVQKDGLFYIRNDRMVPRN